MKGNIILLVSVVKDGPTASLSVDAHPAVTSEVMAEVLALLESFRRTLEDVNTEHRVFSSNSIIKGGE